MILGTIGILAYLLNKCIAVIFSGGKEEPSRPLRSGAVEEEGLVHFIIIMGAVRIYTHFFWYFGSLFSTFFIIIRGGDKISSQKIYPKMSTAFLLTFHHLLFTSWQSHVQCSRFAFYIMTLTCPMFKVGTIRGWFNLKRETDKNHQVRLSSRTRWNLIILDCNIDIYIAAIVAIAIILLRLL